MRAATVVQVLQDLFYALLHVLFYLWSLPYDDDVYRFKLADNYVAKTSVTSPGDDVTDDVSALADDDDSCLSAARKSSHHGDTSCLLITYLSSSRIEWSPADVITTVFSLKRSNLIFVVMNCDQFWRKIAFIFYYGMPHVGRHPRNTYVVQNDIFRPSRITNFVQNFVQISNFRPNFVQLWQAV